MVENVTDVPFLAGVPAGSVTLAVMVESPLSGITGSLAIRTIVEPVGARSGNVSQAVSGTRTTSGRSQGKRRDRLARVTIITLVRILSTSCQGSNRADDWTPRGT